jgi:hypothetical protein
LLTGVLDLIHRQSLVSPIVAAFLVVSAGCASAEDRSVTGLFDKRYCEILTVSRSGLKLEVTVFNTIGYNDCPADAWKALDAEVLKQQFDVDHINLNGPRFWMVDGIVGKGVSAKGRTETFGGITMAERATLSLSLFSARPGETPYTVGEVKRETIWLFKAGKPVFELTDPEGNIYVMQSYSQIVDPSLTLDTLPGLGQKLKLPEGWRYSTRILDGDFRLEAKGVAHVVQDDLLNTYQRRSP